MDYSNGVFRRKKAFRHFLAGSIVGCHDHKGYILIKMFGIMHKAHRLVWLMETGSWPKGWLDHINGIPDDNRFENLREATCSQNSFNRKKASTNKSSIKGVHWQAVRKEWVARIMVHGKRYYIGRFFEIKEAQAAVKKAREKLHYEFHNHGN